VGQNNKTFEPQCDHHDGQNVWLPGSTGIGLQAEFFFFSEQLAYLFTSSTMNTGVGYACLPIEQMLVLLLQATERTALESVIFYIPYASFDFALGVYRQIHLIKGNRDNPFALPIRFIPCTGRSSCWWLIVTTGA